MEPLKIISEQLVGIGRESVALAPHLAVSFIILAVTWAVVRASVLVFGRAMKRSSLRPSLIDVLQKIIAVSIWIVGSLIAATVLFPNLTPAKLLAGLGVGSIAIGLAFKDIFENFLAGILILLREAMRLNDHIECEGVDGQVVKITIRDTYIRRTDGQLVLVPNALLFKNPVFILTDRPRRRVAILCGVAYGADIDTARSVIEKAVRSVESVECDQPVQVYAQAFGSSSIDFEITWWTGSRPAEVRQSRDQVVTAVKKALDDAGIEIPFPHRTLTFKEPLQLSGQGDGDGEIDSAPSLTSNSAE